MPELKFAEFGKNRKIRKDLDPQGIMNKKHFRNYQTVDIFPLDILIDLNQEKTANEEKNKPFSVKYLYSETRQVNILANIPPPLEFFRQLCESYDLEPVNALRIFTDNPITSIDSISNVFMENKISDTINQATDNAVLRSIQELSYFVPTIKLDDNNKPAKQQEQGTVGAVLSTGLQTLSSIASRGMKVALPKIWKNTTYAPSLSVNITLSSPYGSPESIEHRIIRPLVYLLLMASPVTYDGLIYFNPFYQTVRIYGIADYPIAFIRSISISKSSSEIPNNKYRQPLKLDITLTIEPLFSGFAAISHYKSPFTKIQDVMTPINNSQIPELGSGMILVDNIINSFRPAPEELVTNVYPDLPNCNIGRSTSSIVENLNNIFEGNEKLEDLLNVITPDLETPFEF